ncbi:MAG: hypothetical protein ACXVQQ_03555 [Gaiellaceae bacterium]
MAVLILAGCGGSRAEKAQWRTVSAAGFHFRAPAAWSVATAKGRTTARDGADFVQVATFALVRPYDASLFTRVQTELAARMAVVARESGGTVAGHRVVTVAGSRSHSYDVRVGKRIDRYTFVLRGKREFLLLCSADAAVCDELAASFATG